MRQTGQYGSEATACGPAQEWEVPKAQVHATQWCYLQGLQDATMQGRHALVHTCGDVIEGMCIQACPLQLHGIAGMLFPPSLGEP